MVLILGSALLSSPLVLLSPDLPIIFRHHEPL